MFADPSLLKHGKDLMGKLPKIGDPVQMAMDAGKKAGKDMLDKGKTMAIDAGKKAGEELLSKIPGVDAVKEALKNVGDVGAIAAGLA